MFGSSSPRPSLQIKRNCIEKGEVMVHYTEKQNQIKTKKTVEKRLFLGRWQNPLSFYFSVCGNSKDSGVYKKKKTLVCVLFVRCVFSSLSPSSSSSSSPSLVVHYAIRIDWMIWKMAEPHTTKMNSASSHGPTGYFSSAALFDLGTLPRWVMLRLAFSLAMRILCCGAIAVLCR